MDFISKRIVSEAKHINGHWGQITSTVDWCELNYDYSYYIAEFFNTFSSFTMCLIGLVGAYLHYGRFELRSTLTFFSIAVVGLGSAGFHGTLLFELQMFDELPMIYAALLMTYSMIELPNKKPKYQWLPLALSIHAIITTILVAFPVIAPAYSSSLAQFICFHLSFGILEVYLFIKATIMYMKETDPIMKQLHKRGAVLWVIGVICWIFDYFGCETIWEGKDSFRERFLYIYFPNLVSNEWIYEKFTMPNPQLHAWWHLSASVGLYLMTLGVMQRRSLILGDTVELLHYFGFVPYLRLKDAPENQPLLKDHYNLKNKIIGSGLSGIRPRVSF